MKTAIVALGVIAIIGLPTDPVAAQNVRVEPNRSVCISAIRNGRLGQTARIIFDDMIGHSNLFDLDLLRVRRSAPISANLSGTVPMLLTVTGQTQYPRGMRPSLIRYRLTRAVHVYSFDDGQRPVDYRDMAVSIRVVPRGGNCD